MGRLFTFVISLVLVGTTLFVATRIAIGQVPEVDKPAMPVPQRVRARASEAPVDQRDDARRRGQTVSPWRRVRSVVLLVILLTVLGLLLALAIAIFGAVVLNALRSAVQ